MVPRFTDDAAASLERIFQHVQLADLIYLSLQIIVRLLLGITAADQVGVVRVIDLELRLYEFERISHHFAHPAH